MNNKVLLTRAKSLLPSWLPGGRWIKTASIDEYRCGPWSVNTKGAWCNWETGQHGEDMLSLFAAVHNLSDSTRDRVSEMVTVTDTDDWTFLIADYLDGRRGKIRSKDILTAIGVPANEHDYLAYRRVATVLRSLGWHRACAMVDGVATRVWYPGYIPQTPAKQTNGSKELH